MPLFTLLLAAAPALAAPMDDGVTAMTESRFADAKTAFTAATVATPTDAEAWWQLGWADYQLKDFAAAKADWERVKALDPKHDAELDMRLSAATIRAQWLASTPPPADVPLKADTSKTISFAAIGDTMMGSDLKRGADGLAPGDGEILFAETGDWLRGADVAFANLEGPLADGLPSTKCGPASTSCYAFRTPTRYAKALVSAGIDVGQISNNHAMDEGAPGMDSTMSTLDNAGIAHTGRYGDIAIVERKGLKIAFIGAHSGNCCLNDNDLDEVSKAVAWADSQADLVVFVFHGGAEGATARHVPMKTEIAWGEPRGDVHALAHTAIDAGADLVIGTGPHVLRAMETYRGRLIAYSLGNYTGYKQFGTSGGYGADTVLLEVQLAANGVLVGAKVHPLAMDADSVPHPDPNGLGITHLTELTDADFPKTGVKFAADGTITWTPAP